VLTFSGTTSSSIFLLFLASGLATAAGLAPFAATATGAVTAGFVGDSDF
jgi:hypothetical protein